MPSIDIRDMNLVNPPLPFQLSSQVKRSSYGITRSKGLPKWAFGYEECDKDYRIDRPDGFPIPVIEIILEGEGVANAQQTAQPIKRGSTWKYGPESPIAFEANPSAPFRKIFIAKLQAAPFEPLFDDIDNTVHDCVSKVELIEALYRELALTARRSDRYSGAKSDALVSAILALISQCAEPGKPNAAHERLIQSAFSVLESDFAELQSVTQWAEKLRVSPNHLSRVLKARLGKPPYYVLLDHKINRAFHLLSAGVGNVKTVAAMVGFADQFHFSRLFKKRIGFPPSYVSK